MSFMYERGWRQAFSWAGFPGELRFLSDCCQVTESVMNGWSNLQRCAGADSEYNYAIDCLQPAVGQARLQTSASYQPHCRHLHLLVYTMNMQPILAIVDGCCHAGSDTMCCCQY